MKRFVKTTGQMAEARDYCWEVYETVLAQLSERLNSIHNVSYPARYWAILMGSWLLHFIEVLYDRYKRIEKTLELFPDFYTSALPEEKCSLVSSDTYDFLVRKVSRNNYYNLKLFSMVVRKLCPQHVRDRDVTPKVETGPKTLSFKHSLKREIFYKLLRLFDIFIKNPIVLSDMYHLDPMDILALKFKSLKTLVFMDFEPLLDYDVSKNCYSDSMRKKLKLGESSDRFQSLLYKVIPDAIPTCYLENYRIYKDSIGRAKNTMPISAIGSAIGWFFNERFKFFAAEASLKGTLLIEFQRGGNFGYAAVLSHEAMTLLEKDIFYTWGWTSEINNKTKPLPSPHLSKLRDTHSTKLDNVLFIGVVMSRYHYRFQSALLSDDMPGYFEDKKIFFQALSEEIKNKVLYRPYVDDRGWGELDKVKKVCPKAKFISKGKAIKWMQRVKLVVIDHPHTSFLEALAINVPCVFYWKHDVYSIRPEAERYFELLRDAGIVFKDPLSAAEKVKEIFNDPMNWWQSDGVQKARFEFCKRFAYAEKNWLKIWTEELKKFHVDISKKTKDAKAHC
ncbi:MAG: hypothetical protein JSV93_05385 [Candidatus Omnitrophota bacterium]|nr:MAG: hypothetical protein JSV93_05385 [Candidatus Omnitrophota bacterium]